MPERQSLLAYSKVEQLLVQHWPKQPLPHLRLNPYRPVL
jgi:hypothetical protein